MDSTDLLFSFKGRVNRARYWLVVAINLTLFAAAVVSVQLSDSSGSAIHWSVLVIIVSVVTFICLIYAGFAVTTKRLHDRDKSAWWLLVFYLVPAILRSAGAIEDDTGTKLVLRLATSAIGIWAIVELGFLRGTTGQNRYGPDPLGQEAELIDT